jgi:alpha-tubulin suppressor-like RCC1 family protein
MFTLYGNEKYLYKTDVLMINRFECDTIKILTVCNKHHNTFILDEGGNVWIEDRNNKIPHIFLTDRRIQKISCGNNHFVVGTLDQEIYGMGDNFDGQLGLGMVKKVECLQYILKCEGIKMMTCGRAHTIICKSSNECISFGCNMFGQLGLGDTNNRYYPYNLNLFGSYEIEDIQCGNDNTIIYTKSGELFTFGMNVGGESGLSKSILQTVPKLCMKDVKIKQICCGNNHTLILMKCGELWGFGSNLFGQLGLDYHRENVYLPKCIRVDENIILISCGGNHSLLYTNKGELYGFGSNEFYELGQSADLRYSYEPILITSNPSLKYIMNTTGIKIQWSPQTHQNYPDESKSSILGLLLYLKRVQLQIGIFIPKFIRFEIIKFLV